VLLFFGFVAVAGTSFVQAGAIPASAWWGGLVSGAFTTAILVVNNTRDHATDRAAGRKTLPARFGRGAGVVELVVCLGVAYLGTVGLVVTGAASRWALLALATAPAALMLLRTVWRRDDGPTLNRALAHTGGLLLLHNALLAIGMLL
jgi:1,4-dihydroxy-2-naphthoate octaprenyltransferase